MFSRLGYVVRETGANLRRNLTLTAASLLTVAITLSLFGLALLVQKAVDNTTGRWKNGVEFIVFMKPDAGQDQIDAVDRDLKDNPQVASDKVRFLDKQQAYEEFKRLYPDTPELVNALTPAQMPTSFRVVPRTDDSGIIDAIGGQFAHKPGVSEVVYAKKAVDWIRTISNFLRYGFLGAAVVLALGAVMLIWNTIRTAMFARRREIEVMKLVGATNWFIRVPFMLEGLLQGLVGALLSCAVLWGGNRLWTSSVIEKVTIVDLQQLQVSTGEFRTMCVWLILGGMVVGALGSGIAVTRFLDV
jgi:cell division transport system permease protein